MMRALALAAALALTGCGTVAEIIPPRACTPPGELMVKPLGPRVLPERVTPLREAIALWAQDRADAADLAVRMSALQGWVRGQCGVSE